MDIIKLENKLLSNCRIAPSPNGKFQDCWYWTKGKSKGYGWVWFEGKHHNVHRLAAMLWLDFNIDMKHLLVCHQCDNPSCFNPNHLFIGDNSDNQLDRYSKGRYRTKILEVALCQ